MAKYKVLKPIKDLESKKMITPGGIIDRNVSDVTKFEKKWGKTYLERVEEKEPEKSEK